MSSSKATQKRKTNIQYVVKRDVLIDLTSDDEKPQDGEKNGSAPSCEEKVAAANNKEIDSLSNDRNSKKTEEDDSIDFGKLAIGDLLEETKARLEAARAARKEYEKSQKSENNNSAPSREETLAAGSNKGIDPPSTDGTMFLELSRLESENARLLKENARLESLLRKQTAELNQSKKTAEKMQQKMYVLKNDLLEQRELLLENHRLMKESKAMTEDLRKAMEESMEEGDHH